MWLSTEPNIIKVLDVNYFVELIIQLMYCIQGNWLTDMT